MDKTEKYHPSLFEQVNDFVDEEEQTPIIPQNTLYDITLQTHHMPMRKHITIFGFSQNNRSQILEKVKKCTKEFRKEEGRNWMSVWTDDISSLDEILKLNHKIVNGEIIGVFRKSFGAIEDTDIYLKKKGLFRVIYEYFFGE